MKKAKNIAFIISESKKSELIEWSYFNRNLLSNHNIIATGAAISILEGTLNKPVNKLVSGPLGGYRMMADIIAEGKIDALVLFTSNEVKHNDFDFLMDSVKDNNIIVAFNKSTADFIFASPLMQKEYFVKTPVKRNEQKQAASEAGKDKLKIISQFKAA